MNQYLKNAVINHHHHHHFIANKEICKSMREVVQVNEEKEDEQRQVYSIKPTCNSSHVLCVNLTLLFVCLADILNVNGVNIGIRKQHGKRIREIKTKCVKRDKYIMFEMKGASVISRVVNLTRILRKKGEQVFFQELY